jgi:para-aminobenzoate synthetase/4-amino-4-deoxychorismate lyase
MRIIFNDQLFDNPSEIISCHKLSEVRPAFEKMEKAIARGCYLAGFFSYEAGYAFEEIFHNNKTYDFPLVYFGVFPCPRTLSLWERGAGSTLAGEGCNLSRQNYFAALRRIQHLITAGETYQVNYTFKQRFNFTGEPYALYQQLKKRQHTPYSAFIDSKDFSILSLSPELFFRKTGDRISVKPMKGTIGLGRNNDELLKNDEKNRNENIMIVDLLRNDLGRIAEYGSVEVKRLFEVEKHKTLYQMTSTIEANIEPTIQLYELFRNLFPSGSVTGAPKIRAMQVIQELEEEERNIYCGSIGVITPERDMVFNVAIRTLLLETRDSRLATYTGELGLGSGIISDSDPESEYEECLLKAKFLVG